MRVAAYVRVSTQRQAQTQSLAQQLERIQAHCQQQGWNLPTENIFQDDGYSGANFKRPGLERLRDAATQARFDRLLITAPDRLARNYVHQALLLEELQQHGCQLEFLDRPMTQDPHDQLLLQIRGAVAKYERTLIAERMRRGRLAKLKAGVLLPWTKPPYGYRLDPDRPRDPRGVRLDEVEAVIVKEIFALYLDEKTSLSRLAKQLQTRGIKSPNGNTLWNPTTLLGSLTNPVYTGEVYSGRMRPRPARVRRSATHPIGKPKDSYVPVPRAEWLLVARVPALITQQEFEQVKAKLARNLKYASRNNKAHDYLLRALVSCGHCRLACAGRLVHPGYDYYTCSGKREPVQSRRLAPCRARYAPVQQLDELVWNDLVELLQQPEALTQALAQARGGAWLPQQLQARRGQLQRGQASLRSQLERLTEAYLGGIVPLPEYDRRRRDLEAQQQALDQQWQDLNHQTAQQAELAGYAAGMTEFARRVASSLANLNFDQKRQLVELLIDRVIVTDELVEIRYAIPTSPAGEKLRFCQLRTDYFTSNKQTKAGDLIRQLNPMIRGWANYHRHVVSKETFADIDRVIFQRLWRWAKRRHRTKPYKWIKDRYFTTCKGDRWVFYGEIENKDGSTRTVHLLKAASVPIKRHIKIKGEANPYDLFWEEHFERRIDVKMDSTLKGRRQLLTLYKEQGGICPICHQELTEITEWHRHPLIRRTNGGKHIVGNLVLLHPECHRQVHRQGLMVVKPRP
jgi:site-specific DNA recombinase